jgi:hypothetical protein
MVGEQFVLSGRMSASMEQCCFLAALMHDKITNLRIPALECICHPPSNIVWRLVAFFKNLFWESPLTFYNKSCHGAELLMDAITTKSTTLKSLHFVTKNTQHWRLPHIAPVYPLRKTLMGFIKGSSLSFVFFGPLLRRLTSLRIDCYLCDDWALKQIADHAYNLV